MMKKQLAAMTALVLLTTAYTAHAQIGFGAGASGGSPSNSPGGMTRPNRGVDSGTTLNTHNSGAVNSPAASNPNVGGADAGFNTGVNARSNALRGFPSRANNSNFNNYIGSRWDQNGDGYINTPEWQQGVQGWYGSSVGSAGNFSKWDLNNDGMLDRTESGRGFSNTRVFQMYDTNNDGLIDQSESARIPR